VCLEADWSVTATVVISNQRGNQDRSASGIELNAHGFPVYCSLPDPKRQKERTPHILVLLYLWSFFVAEGAAAGVTVSGENRDGPFRLIVLALSRRDLGKSW
jgi:hypothetical protein